MNNIVSGAMTFSSLMKIMSLQIPLLLGYLLPLAFYLSILVVLGRMYLDHEIIILSSSGMTDLQLFGKIAQLAAILTVIVAILMFWIEPKVQWYRLNLKAQAAAEISVDKIIPGQFLSLRGNNRTFYAQDAEHRQHLLTNVFYAQQNPASATNKKPGWDIVIARQATDKLLPEYQGHFVIFHDGYRYTGTPGEKSYKIEKFENYGFKLKSSALSLSNQIKFMPTLELLKQYQKNPQARAEFQWRLAMPISVMLLSLLGFLLSKANPRQGKFTRLFPAILCYVLYANTLFIAKAWIAHNHRFAWLGMWWCHGLLLLLCLCLIASRSTAFKQKLTSWIKR